MVTLTADVTKGIKEITERFVRTGLYKSQSEVVRDAIRQLALKYELKQVKLDEIKKITEKAFNKSQENLSRATIKLRQEI